MGNNFEQFRSRAKQVADAFRAVQAKEVLLVHHNDTDGLTSGTILLRAFERGGHRVRRVCLEKPYPIALELLLKDAGSCVVFTDFASGMLSEINRISAGRHSIFVVDHHTVDEKPNGSIQVLNPLQHGISGSEECSASAVCFEFALALSDLNSDLANLGVLGALGDRQFSAAGRLQGLNAQIFERARTLGIAAFGDEYLIRSGFVYKGSNLVEHLDALGSFGYFEGGTDVAVKGLCEGFDERYVAKALALREVYTLTLSGYLASKPLTIDGRLIWFDTGETFAGMGVKTVGLVCEAIKDIYPSEPYYVVGFQAIPNEIPGLGHVSLNQVKVSMRISDKLHADVRAGNARGVDNILTQAVKELGGFVDACHVHAGAGTIKPGLERQLIQSINKLVE